MAKAKEADELAELRAAVLAAMDAYRAAWLGEPKEAANG